VIDFPTGGTATSTQNAGGTLVNGGTVATDPSAAPGTSAVGPNIMPSIDRAPTSGVGDITMGTGSRWTDTGNLKTLTLDCWGESSFSGSAWQGDCRVITPGMMSLDLTLETTSHTWSLTTGSGCSPFKVEDAVLGTETVLRLMFVGTNIPTCVPSTTVQLRATTHNGTVFTLSKRLYL
jgi:hypothetical protein